jgi:putative transposase
MPPKNSVKIYISNSYYHIYNRGVEKRKIFEDLQDYNVCLNYIKQYLEPKKEVELREKLAKVGTSTKEKEECIKLLRLKNYADELHLISYILMPNHFHFLFFQKKETSIAEFMNSFANRYAMYFNAKYQRVGRLYQDVYRGVLVESEEQLLCLSRYIHRNDYSLQGVPLQAQPSSYPEYLGKRQTPWIHSEHILPYFSRTNPSLLYRSYVESQETEEIISKLTIDTE